MENGLEANFRGGSEEKEEIKGAEKILAKLTESSPEAFKLSFPKLMEALKNEYRKIPLIPEEQSIAFIQQVLSPLQHVKGALTGNKRVDAFRAGQIEGQRRIFQFIKKWREDNEMGAIGVRLNEKAQTDNQSATRLLPVHDRPESKETESVHENSGDDK